MIPSLSLRRGRRPLGRGGIFLAIVLASAFAAGCGVAPQTAALAPMPGAPTEDLARAEPAPTSASALPQARPSGDAPAPGAPETAPAQAPAQHAAQAKQDPNAPKLDDAARPLLVYEGALGVQVPKASMPDSIEKAIDIAEAHGGYLVSRTDAGAQLRVPSQRFRVTLKELGALGEVTRRSVSAQDVSEQFHDLEVRLKNLESVRIRLEQFLARAANVDEALRVGKELEGVVRQIDEAKGRMQYLKTRASYSLITLALEPAPERPLVAIRDEKPSTPPARPLRLPVKWLKNVGLDGLLRLE